MHDEVDDLRRAAMVRELDAQRVAAAGYKCSALDS